MLAMPSAMTTALIAYQMRRRPMKSTETSPW